MEKYWWCLDYQQKQVWTMILRIEKLLCRQIYFFLNLHSYYFIFDLLIFSCSNIVPWINVSGRGGHPGTYTSTGMIPSTPGSTLYESIYNPPVIAHAPIAITYFGSGIWSYTSRSLGAIFLFTVPRTIIKSHCRSEPKASRTPYRSKSYLGLEAAPSSTLQHPVSK